MKAKRIISLILVLCMCATLVPCYLFTDAHATDNTAWYDARVDQTLANIGSENYTSSNPFNKGQCTWYCFGRAIEKCGVYLPAWKTNGTYGNADEWYDYAASSGFSVGYEVRSNSIACFSGMHVIFVEWVDGETVYYTEANKDSNGTYNSGVDCILVKSTITKLRQRLNSTYQGCIYLGDNETVTNTPVDPWITASATTVQAGTESVTFKYGATYATGYTIGVDQVGVGRVLTQDAPGGSITLTFNAPGEYSIYVTCYNEVGYEDTSVVKLTVYDKYTITYNANGGSGAPASQTKDHGTALILSSVTPTGKTYTVTFNANGGTAGISTRQVRNSFSEWNTKSDGSGTSYLPSGVYSVNASATLYAQWNGTKLGTVDDAERAGYYFRGWYDSTSVDSAGNPTGTEYNSSSIISKNITLYAMWEEANTLYFGDVDQNGSVESKDLTKVNKVALGKDTPEYDAEEFNLRADLNKDGEITSDDVTILNQIRQNQVSQDELMADYVGSDVSGLKTSYAYGEAIDVSALTLDIVFDTGIYYSITEGLTVSGYDPYDIGEQTITVHFYQFSAAVVVEVLAPKYTISYNANGGSGAPANQTKTGEVALTLSSVRPTRFGYNFIGWSTSATASDATYQPGDKFATDAHTTLYAVWSAAETIFADAEVIMTPQSKYGEVGYYYKLIPGVSTSYSLNLWDGDEEGIVSITLYDSSKNALVQISGRDDEAFSEFDCTLEYVVTSGETYYVYLEFTDTNNDYVYLAVHRGYLLSYNANGGSNAPVQEYFYFADGYPTVNSQVPTRKGYTFIEWNTKSDGTGNAYAPGNRLNEGWANVTLYAIWEKGCPNSSHNYSYSVTKKPTNSATGTLTGTCSDCSGTTTVTLPRLNTSNYSYKVVKEATCAANGTGRYTWKTTTYGSVYFDVTIPVSEHQDTNSDGLCDICATAMLLGDLNLDGLVDSDDLTLLARHVGGIELLTANTALTNADVNSDGQINSDDLTIHARYVGGIIADWENT